MSLYAVGRWHARTRAGLYDVICSTWCQERLQLNVEPISSSSGFELQPNIVTVLGNNVEFASFIITAKQCFVALWMLCSGRVILDLQRATILTTIKTLQKTSVYRRRFAGNKLWLMGKRRNIIMVSSQGRLCDHALWPGYEFFWRLKMSHFLVLPWQFNDVKGPMRCPTTLSQVLDMPLCPALTQCWR